jgi:DinB family protein
LSVAFDLKTSLLNQLTWHWQAQARPRFEGMEDHEYLWEPAPPPVTTIAWRLAHIADVMGARANYHFGDRTYQRTAGGGEPATAAAALAAVDAAYDAWTTGVLAWPDDRLLEKPGEGEPGSDDANYPFAELILHISREVIHHASEVATLRDIYAATHAPNPLVVAIITGDRAAIDIAEPGALDAVRVANPSLLLRVVEHGTTAGVELAVALGFDVNVKTDRSPLHHAAAAGDIEKINALLAAGARLDARDVYYDATPREWAEFFGKAEAAALLSVLRAPSGFASGSLSSD